MLVHFSAASQNLKDTIPIRQVRIVQSSIPGEGIMLISRMDSLPMTARSSHSLSELLASHSSLHIRSTSRGALSTAAFRGTDASHTKVYWNGIPLNSPIYGQVDLSLLPVWFVDDLSLLYGSSSLSQGSGALGGSLLLDHRADWSEGARMHFIQEIASFGTWGSFGRFRLGRGIFLSDTRFFDSRSRNDYPFFNNHDLPHRIEKLEQASYHQKGLMQHFALRSGHNHQVSMHIWYQDADRNLPPVMSYDGAGRKEYQLDRNLRSSLEWKHYGSAGNLTLRSGWVIAKLNYHFSETTSTLIHYDSENRENSIYNSLKYELKRFKNTRVNLKLDYNYHNVLSRETIGDYGYSRDRRELSVTGSASRELGPRLTTFLLLRQEYTDGHWLPVMPSAGIRCKPVKDRDAALKLSFSRNYNTPSLSGLYAIPGGNPGLLPEKAWQGDLGLEMNHFPSRRGFSTGINFYAAMIDNWILWRPNPVYNYWEAENIAKVFSRGLEFRMKTRFRINILNMNAGANYALSKATNRHAPVNGDDSRGKQLVYIPLHSANGYVNASFSGWYLNLAMSYTGKRFTRSSNEEGYGNDKLDPCFLTDLYAGKDWKIKERTMGIKFTVYNVLNVHYQAVLSRPMPGRYLSLILKVEI